MERELARTKDLVSDLVLTLGTVNTRLEHSEGAYLDLSVEVKEKNIILSGVSQYEKRKISNPWPWIKSKQS